MKFFLEMCDLGKMMINPNRNVGTLGWANSSTNGVRHPVITAGSIILVFGYVAKFLQIHLKITSTGA